MKLDHKLSTLLTVEQMAHLWGGPATVTPAGPELHVAFVCSYNLGRSPMAAAMFAHQLRERGLGDRVRVSSGGTANWTWGNPMDKRGAEVLRANGYGSPEHHSAPVSVDTGSADLVVAMEEHHVTSLRHYFGVPANKIRLLRPGGIKNPYSAADFEHCFGLIEAALPELHSWVDDQLALTGGTNGHQEAISRAG